MAHPRPSNEVEEHDQRVHRLIGQITEALQAIPGATEVELVQHQGNWAAWGFLYEGETPCSFSWNVTP